MTMNSTALTAGVMQLIANSVLGKRPSARALAKRSLRADAKEVVAKQLGIDYFELDAIVSSDLHAKKSQFKNKTCKGYKTLVDAINFQETVKKAVRAYEVKIQGEQQLAAVQKAKSISAVQRNREAAKSQKAAIKAGWKRIKEAVKNNDMSFLGTKA